MTDESVNGVGTSHAEITELRELVQRERAVTAEQTDLRARIEHLIRTRLLAGNPPRGRVTAVEQATGYSREWVRRLRAGETSWKRDPSS